MASASFALAKAKAFRTHEPTLRIIHYTRSSSWFLTLVYNNVDAAYGCFSGWAVGIRVDEWVAHWWASTCCACSPASFVFINGFRWLTWFTILWLPSKSSQRLRCWCFCDPQINLFVFLAKVLAGARLGYVKK